MKRIPYPHLTPFVLIGLCFLYGFEGFGQKKLAEHLDYRFSKIGDGIYVASTPNPYTWPVQGNVTIIINDRDVIVVDATGMVPAAQLIISEIKKLTNKPVRYLITTHFHDDHNYANSEFLKAFPGAEIISSKFTRDKILSDFFKDKFIKANREAGYKDVAPQLNQIVEEVTKEAYPGYEKVVANLNQAAIDIPNKRKSFIYATYSPPSLIIENQMVIYRGEREIRIIPGAGDTPGDLWIYLPKEKIIISGDAVVRPTPYGGSTTPIEWISTLEKMEQLDFNTLVPGHGDVQTDKTYLHLMIDLLKSIRDQAQASIKQGLSKDEALAKITITEIEEKFTGGDALKRFYFEQYFKGGAFANMYDALQVQDFKK